MGLSVKGHAGTGEDAAEAGQAMEGTVKAVLAHARADRMSMAAGSLAYHWFLALFPAIIALLGLSALVGISPHLVSTLVHGTAKALPAGAAGVLTRAIQHAHTRVAGALAATLVAGAAGLWSASSAMTVLQTALNMAYEVPRGRRFVGKRAMAFALMLATMVLGGLASALVVFGAQIGAAVKGHAPVAGTAFLYGWTAVRWVVVIALVATLFSTYYFLGPKRQQRGKWVTPGGLLGTFLWLIISLAFSFYTTKFGSYGRTYGAFAGVVILIFWLYLTGIAVLLGAELNAELERRHPGEQVNPAAGTPAGQATGPDPLYPANRTHRGPTRPAHGAAPGR